MLVAILYLSTVLSLTRGENVNNTYDICDSDYKYANNINITINITESCSEKSPCIGKCCPEDHILVLEIDNYTLTCLENTYITSLYNISNLDDYSDVVFHENNVKQNIRESAFKMGHFIKVYKDGFVNEDCSMDVEDAFPKPTNQVYILEVSVPNRWCCSATSCITDHLTGRGTWQKKKNSLAINRIKQNIRESAFKMGHFIKVYKDGFVNEDCSMDVEDAFPKPTNQVYILENGTAVIRHPNYYNQWFLYMSPIQFCVDHQIVVEADGYVSKPELVFRTLTEGDEGSKSFDKNTLTASAMLVSCVFLLLVLVVYALLEQLRNLAGMMLMTYVTTLTATFLIRAVQVIVTNNEMTPPKAACIWIGLIAHYTLVASFTWMNVMSFDIWWSMRGFRKMRQIHRRGVLVKFGWYSLYGWGVPLLLTLFIITVENLDLTHLPNFVKSNYLNEFKCFIEEQEQLLYLDCPILLTTCINIMLFLMTAYNIWRIKQGVSQHSAGNSRRIKKNETRFGIYLKLSLVMGISWILEVVSAFYEKESLWWYAPDVFNSLTGLFIFIIFICKRNIIVQLCKRFRIKLEFVHRWETVDSTETESTRLHSTNSRYKRKKTVDSVTETSEIYDHDRKYYLDHADLKLNNKPS